MKFRAVAGTDLVVSEVGYAVGARSGFDPLLTQRMVRLAYDEGVNLFCLPVGPLHDAAVAAAMSGDLRNKVFLSASVAWPAGRGQEGIEAGLSARLSRLGTDRVDILFFRNVPPAALADGSAGDAIHRLRASGKARHVGLSSAFGHPMAPRAAERCGASLIDFSADEMRGDVPRALALEFDRPAEAPRLSAVARFGAGFSSVASPSMSFLWHGTGRTPAQALIALTLNHPWVSSAVVAADSEDELREAARAPLAPAITDRERTSLRAADRSPALAEA